MYYPYLRAKQFELKALREFSEEYSGSSVVPILEPVKKQSAALERAVGDMMRNKMRFALVLNPTDGDFKHDTVSCKEYVHADGICFKSSLYPGGVNYVLFDPKAADCVSVESHVIGTIDIDR